jgi:D-alanine-D-alanine ligase
MVASNQAAVANQTAVAGQITDTGQIATALRAQLGKVAVLMGGISAEREVSLLSGAAVLKGLQDKGVDAHSVDANPSNIGELKAMGFDRAFIVLHGRWGEDGVVQGAMQAIGLPFTGSGVLGCALAMDKVRTKQVWQSLGLPTAKYRVLNSKLDLEGLVDELGLPIFLKPAREGSSVGVAKVTKESELLEAYRMSAQVGDQVLAEQFIVGAELTCTILKGQALPVIRMSTDNEFYDYQAKYQSDDTEYFCPAGLDDALEQQVRALALSAFNALDCSVWGRVDVMLDDQNQPLLLEVNTVPGMTSHSLVPMAAKVTGRSFEDLVLEILETTLDIKLEQQGVQT